MAIKKKRMGVLDDPAAQPRTILQPTTGMLESGDASPLPLTQRNFSSQPQPQPSLSPCPPTPSPPPPESPAPTPQPQPVLRTQRDPELSAWLQSQPTSCLHPAQVLAVMGPSGSGKTTLLDAVSGRTRKDKVRGTVFFNGRADIPFAQRNRLLSCRPQCPLILTPTLTVTSAPALTLNRTLSLTLPWLVMHRRWILSLALILIITA